MDISRKRHFNNNCLRRKIHDVVDDNQLFILCPNLELLLYFHPSNLLAFIILYQTDKLICYVCQIQRTNFTLPNLYIQLAMLARVSIELCLQVRRLDLENNV